MLCIIMERVLLKAVSWVFPKFTILLAMLCAFAPDLARSFDLSEARRDGELVRQALTLGGDGDWDAAQNLVAKSHPVVRDIVLWRKLRARKGTVEEYRDFRSRRTNWPGSDSLAAMYGFPVTGTSRATPRLSGAPAESFKAYRAQERADNYEEAETLLIAASASRATVGVWAAASSSMWMNW